MLEHELVDDYPGYDFNRDIDEIKLNIIIDKYKESQDVYNRFESRVFYYSKFKYNSVRQFSISSKIPYGVCLRAYDSFKEKVKEELCKY